MKLISYTVNLSFTNAPSITASVALTDPITGEERTESIAFVDDEARAIVAMVPNPTPGGRGMVADPDGRIDVAKLSTALGARVNAAKTPATLAAQVAAAEDARRAQRAAQAATKAAEDAKAEAEAETARLKAEAAALDAEIAKKRSTVL